MSKKRSLFDAHETNIWLCGTSGAKKYEDAQWTQIGDRSLSHPAMHADDFSCGKMSQKANRAFLKLQHNLRFEKPSLEAASVGIFQVRASPKLSASFGSERRT
jgi:hypothetical protein